MPMISTFTAPVITIQSNIAPAVNFTTTSATAIDVTGWAITLPNRAGGKAIVSMNILYNNSGLNGLTNFQILDNGVTSGGILQVQDFAAAGPSSVTIVTTTTLSGQIIKLSTTSIGGVNTVTVYGTNATIYGRISSLEIS